jgi:NitT/TauT family transport system substrate-binding protein
MKAAKFLDPKVDVAELAKKAWLDLPGVTDEWIKNVEVEKVAGGGPPPRLTPEMMAALFDRQEASCSCCCAPKVGADGKLTCP